MKQFLASVGTAKLFAKRNGKLVHIADTKTLTQSTISFSTQFEEVRAGSGAVLLGRFNHDSDIDITLSDMMWDLNYLSLMVGSLPSDIGAEHSGLFSEQISHAGPTIILSKMPVNAGGSCGLTKQIVWLKEVDCQKTNDPIVIEINNNSRIISTPRNLIGKKICIEYFINIPQSKAITVPAVFVPAELVLLLTTKIFNGDSNNPETGKPIGEITIKVPRFSLNGNTELRMSAAQATEIEITGKALLSTGSCCDANGVYAEIVEINYSSTAATGLLSLEVDPESVVPRGIPKVYGYYKDGHISEISFEDCIFIPEIDKSFGLVAGERYTVYVGSIFTTFEVESHFKGNPIIINSNMGADNTATLYIYDKDSSYEEESIEENANIAFIGGNWSLEVIGNTNSDQFVDYETDDLISMRAGNILLSVIGD